MPIYSVPSNLTNVVTMPVLVTATTYTAGYQVGPLLAFQGLFGTRNSGMVQSICLTCKSAQTVEFDVTVFNSYPGGSKFLDNTTPAIVIQDAVRVLTPFRLTNPYSGLGTHTVYGLDGIGKAINVQTGTLYAVIVSPGAPTFTSTSDVELSIGVVSDN